MTNHCVPDFDIHDDHRHPSPFRSRKSSYMQEDQVMELLWQDGQVVMQRPPKPLRPLPALNGVGSSFKDSSAPADAPQLFIQEDEMASWLHYPLEDEPQFGRDDFCSDLLFPPPSASCTDTAPTVTDPVHSSPPPPPLKPPVPPAARRTDEGFKPHGFGHFTGFRPRQESVVESNATPAKEAAMKAGFVAGSLPVGGGGAVDTTSLEFTVESSSGANGAEPGLRRSASCDNKKRKGSEGDEIECRSQDVVLKTADTKKQVHGSTTKRNRAAEVHNLSERRRRDRINEKMKALQDLIPRCNKSDKASMLDDAIEYLKSLQMQVQMMSMGCGMVPMMFLGMQQYMQPMGMGMGMGVDVNRPMMPFPMATPTHMGPRFPVPLYHHIPPSVAPDSSRIQVNNQGPILNPVGPENAYRQQVQTIPDHYQQYLGSQIMQMQPPQNDVTTLPNTSNTIPSGGPEVHGGGSENLEPQPLLAEISY